MHQFLSLREWYNPKSGRHEKTDTRHFGQGWGCPSVQELFADPEKWLAPIVEEERVNFYYTVADCTEKKREFKRQSVLVVDIDGTDIARLDDYIASVTQAMGIDPAQTGIVNSGNGLHFVVGLATPIEEAGFFEQNRRHYKALLGKIGAELARQNLPGTPDPAVFDPRRIMRLPLTRNVKPGKDDKFCYILQGHIKNVAFDLATASGLPVVAASEQINAATAAKLPAADTQAVLDSCEFLRWCKAEPQELSEAQWYAMLSIVARLPPAGRDLAHDFSHGHPSYSASETESKIDQALHASGPRTCANVNALWGKCGTCKLNGKVKSPIMIQGAKYIRTATTGFHDVKIDAEGNAKTGKPNFKDLRQFFENAHPYVTISSSGIVFTWDGKKWNTFDDNTLQAFAQDHFDPYAATWMTEEFRRLVCRTSQKHPNWFTESVHRKVNFRNGVVDLNTMQLTPHSTECAFRYVLDYDFDPGAKAPVFERFMSQVMKGRQDLVDTLLQFAGYSLSNDKCWAQKALIMTGGGSNGKSTFMTILGRLAGDQVSCISMADLRSETYRLLLDGKLFNLSEETPSYALSESSHFKNLVSGGNITVKALYKQQYSIETRAKLLFSCNDLPETKDTSKGFFRRLLIVPFDAEFEGQDRDFGIDAKLESERSGIFNIVMRAYAELKRTREFPQSEAIDAQLDEYRTGIDPVKDWYDTCITCGPTDGPPVALPSLYASYRAFTEASGEKPRTRSWFGRALKRLLPDYAKRYSKPAAAKGKPRLIYIAGVSVADGAQF